MSGNRWKTIWENRDSYDVDLSRDEFEIFCKLKKADGFDVNIHDENAYFMGFYREWIDMYKQITEMTHGDINSVYEVGCGSGVNLYLFHNRIEKAVLGGIDYSRNLLDMAANIIHSTDLKCDEAIGMEVENKYDLVMANSVFQYFSDVQYAEAVLNKMILKSRKIVYISELHDMEMYDEWLANRRKSFENYDRIYSGLDKTFYSKDWITNIAKKHNKQVMFTHSDNPEYWNSKYTFNCYIY